MVERCYDYHKIDTNLQHYFELFITLSLEIQIRVYDNVGELNRFGNLYRIPLDRINQEFGAPKHAPINSASSITNLTLGVDVNVEHL
jgi:hypothetical protein